MAPKPLKILCFGDSLTEGYTHHGLSYAPYCTTMEKVLDAALPAEEWVVSVDEQGVSGELVLHMEGRMGEIYASNRTSEEPYDLVIFLGGTNDLGYGRSADDIFADIKKVLRIPLDHGARVVVMTVPECAVKSEKLDAKRDALNGSIRGFVEEKEGVFLFDLKEKIPYHSMSEEERKEIWDDGLHFTAKGYARMGRGVGERVVEIMSEGK
ncbi:hypothetical protein LOCC1_G000783 [Lachnellula occidentalis]|uniref:SGNH hydrolase-type esterase domain-containing protein n=1 Tax=Lachnellula occidentalis TaxID=215460 RepID=A0A8H8S8B4_9HELO|nr:hypothetical protein LOCC1_G000783 [Lachnellula occidentalis]